MFSLATKKACNFEKAHLIDKRFCALAPFKRDIDELLDDFAEIKLVFSVLLWYEHDEY